MNLYEKLVDIQGRLKAPKNQYNSFGKYKYRNCEDILEAVKPLLVEHKLVLTISDDISQDYWEDKNMIFVNATAKITDGKDVVEVNAQAGIDPNRKGMDIAQSFGSSSSYARKYALNGLFLIDDTKDADSTNTHDGKPEVKIQRELEWLPKSGAKFDKVKEALTGGFTMSQIREKYKVSKEVEQLLNS
jgi:hypothetical protein